MAPLLKILHTSDWHLGHTLIGASRVYEHDRFLAWLLDLIESERPDALIIAGDIFDSANPPSTAQRQWFQFLAGLSKRTHDHFQTVVIGGNHDSAARLNAPTPLLEAFGIHVVGGVPRTPDRALDCRRLTAPLKNSGGDILAWCAAMPFIRVPDLPRMETRRAGDNLIEGVRALYRELLDHVFALRQPHQAVIATGHCYMSGTQLSELSERKILVGNQHALPPDIFPDSLAYAALGHLHKPQSIGDRDWIRYSGSPIPLSLSEAEYRHRVCLAELAGPELKRIRDIPVPRAVDMIRLPEMSLAKALAELARLDELPPGLPDAQRPFLEVRLRLDKPEPGLSRRLREAAAGKAPRLIKIGLRYTGENLGLRRSGRNLSEIRTEDVFVNCYRRSHEGDPPREYMAMFHELVEDASRGET